MASWRTDADGRSGEDGFATPAAAVISLGLAVVASAVTGLAITELKAADAEAAHVRAAYRLDGLQQVAALSVSVDPKATRFEWTIAGSDGPAEVLAEAEGVKLAPDKADQLGAAPGRLGVQDQAALGRRLQAMTTEEALGPALDAADTSPGWRACGRSLVSAYGQASATPKWVAARPPSPGQVAQRLGEVWRIRITQGDWADDRTVRLTGDLLHPAAVIDRRFYRRTTKGDPCDALLAAR